MTGHTEVEQLLGAYALDAVDPDEAEVVERHLAVCPRCRAELANHREVAGLLGYAGGPAPEGLWERISESLEEAPPALRLERVGLGSVGDGAFVPRHRDGLRSGAGPSRGDGRVVASSRRRSIAARVAGAVAVAAVAAVAVLGIQVSRLDHRTDHLRAAVASSNTTAQTIITALSTPGAHQVSLSSPSGDESLRAVITPSGSGYLFDSKLRPLPANETYQLWGQQGARLVSYGLLGPDPTVVPFRAGHGVLALAVTAEQAGGVVKSSHRPVVDGSIRAAD
jgi:anti-sigma factor RsiW